MTDREAIADWVGGYLSAWDSNAPADVRALFTADAEYRFKPFEPPRRGHDAIVAAWTEGADAPGDHAFSWQVVAVESDTAVVEGRTRYLAGGMAGRTFRNLWVVRLASDGRAASFTEWWMEEPRGAPAP